MTLYALPALFALLLWWFSTGAIFFLDTRPERTFRWSFTGVTLLAVGAVWGTIATSGAVTVASAYVGFACGLAIWGWLETAFYMGFMVGPRRRAPVQRAAGWVHFGQAVATTLYHEVTALALAAVIGAVTWDEPNRLALWTFLLLWLMQISAKLNVFLGVPNLAEEFLPAHLTFLRHYMCRRAMNPFFPVAVTSATAVASGLAFIAASAASSHAAAGFAMLASLATLAVAEHWLLVVPLRLDVLWGWAIARRRPVNSRGTGSEHADPGEAAKQSGAPHRFPADAALIQPLAF